MDKRLVLLDFLKKQEKEKYISAKMLANVLNVTDRTVRHYVKEINAKNPQSIESSREGYRMSQHFLVSSTEGAAGNPVDTRRFYILRRLIKSSERGLDLFDLADTLYLSDATVRADMAYLNRLVTTHNLQIVQKSNRYKLTGDEKGRKKLMINLIDFSKPTKTSLEEEVQKFLGEISLVELMQLTRKNFKKYHVLPNTYFLKNFVLHLAIAMDRTQEEHLTEKKISHQVKEEDVSRIIVRDITKEIADKYKTYFSNEDINELIMLFNGQFKPNQNSAKNYIEPKVVTALDHAIQEISEVYAIEFSDEGFKSRLQIHIQNLYNRLKKKAFTRNLSVLNIRVKYPIIFDIAVYLASVLANDLEIAINDDEIAFIALHIGSYLNNQMESHNKIKTILVTPAYQSQQTEIEQFIQKNFEADLFISEIYDDFTHVDWFTQPELVIKTQTAGTFTANTSVNLPEIVTIREFMTNQDQIIIRKAIEKIKHANYVNFLRKVMPLLIQEEFFTCVADETPVEQVLGGIATIFTQSGYAETNYLVKLIEREAISSTAFPSGVAIPHTMKYEAKQTGLIFLKPINHLDWHGVQVKLIIGLAVNKEDMHQFNMILPRIIELIAESYNVNYLVGAADRNELIERLIELMSADQYFNE